MSIKISQLPFTSGYTGSERIPMVQSASTRAGTLSSLLTYLSSFYYDPTVETLSGTWNDTYTTVYSNSSNWDQAYQLVSFNSNNWNSTYSSVRANSGNWNAAYNTVTNNSANWDSVYSNVKANSALYAKSSDVLKLTGGEVSGNLTVTGNFSATGTSYFANTIYSTTSALSIVNVGNLGAALYVSNDGNGDLASFYDIDSNLEVFHIGGANGSNPYTGIRTSTPNKELTVKGQISASNIIWDLNGNSNNWNSVYSNVNANSGAWTRTPTGSTIYVDSVQGTDTRTGLNKYDQKAPFKTISKAIEASSCKTAKVAGSAFTRSTTTATVTITNHGYLAGETITITDNGQSVFNVSNATILTVTANTFTYAVADTGATTGSGTATITKTLAGDLIYVRSGDYSITSQININGRGDIYFEPGSLVTVNSNIVAFSLSVDEIKKISGFGEFTCSGTGGVWSQSGGTSTTNQAVHFQVYSITNSTGAGTVFSLSTGFLTIDVSLIACFASTIVSNTGVIASCFYNVPFTYCSMLVNMSVSSQTSTFTANCWTVEIYGQEGMSIVGGTLSLDIKNLVVPTGSPSGSTARLVVFKYPDDATTSNTLFRGGRLFSNNSIPCILFNMSSGTNKSLRLYNDVELLTSSTASISSANPRNIIVSLAHSNAFMSNNITTVGGTFMVDTIFQ